MQFVFIGNCASLVLGSHSADLANLKSKIDSSLRDFAKSQNLLPLRHCEEHEAKQVQRSNPKIFAIAKMIKISQILRIK
ncbi:hypothetical protein [Helicobacter sp. 23-1045]